MGNGIHMTLWSNGPVHPSYKLLSGENVHCLDRGGSMIAYTLYPPQGIQCTYMHVTHASTHPWYISCANSHTSTLAIPGCHANVLMG